jgi:spore maturation protein CgeB
MSRRLRIFVAIHGPAHVQLRASRVWYNNLHLPLLDLGHEVVAFDFDLEPFFQNVNPEIPAERAFLEANRPRLEAALLQQVQAEQRRRPLDLFFSYFYAGFCGRETIERIRALGIFTLNWYCNASYQFDLIAPLAPAYDACLVPEKFRLEDYRRIGARPIYCQEAANPNFYRPAWREGEPNPYRHEVTFVGQRYGDRPAYLAHLARSGVPVRAWGVGWTGYAATVARAPGRLRGLLSARGLAYGARRLLRLWQDRRHALPRGAAGAALDDAQMVEVFSRSKINLGFSTVGETARTGRPIFQVRLRDFEVPMAGGFYLTQYQPELEEFFEFGREIECFRTKEELVDKARYYLAPEGAAEREAIRRRGFERARRDHTWHQRLTDAFRQAGLS